MLIAQNQQLDAYIGKAQRFAQEGEVERMLLTLENALICAERIGEDITVLEKEIRYSGYTNAVPLLLEEAKKSALETDLNTMYLCLRMAQIYATQIGEDLTDKIKEIKELSYN